MRIRPGNNPKRRIAPIALLVLEQQAALSQRVRYVGSGHHKRNPADYGLTGTNPRPTKSLCDLNRLITQAEAQHLLEQGIKQGLISEPGPDGYPKYIWAVSEQQEVFEAKTDRHGTGEYHGYPLDEKDDMHQVVKQTRSKLCNVPGH